ncbi:hypothetical protein G7Y89_g2571 [Cudoniella acicularis]|uniref:Oxidoreductase n=1 Tax=Cudoniella acicularis TaxID=354080 RepID=A0A8H4RUY7_9HELO|nr:hypothetical protein G7Y89_g2571 [Cudoniella acicularis]
MAPTRVGFLGLSKSGWAPGAHLPYLKSSPDYEIVAVCNSSVQSAQEAIKLYGLADSTKAYGDPEELAKDKNVDLVVCSVRVDRHLPTISPALRAGKDVYVEWPLGKNLTEAKELLRLKNENGVKNAIVGLQARQAPIVKTIKELVDSGRIGKVLSSTWTSQAAQGGESTVLGYEYMGQRSVGGNLVTIHFGHAVDYVQYVLGYGFPTPPKTLLANRRPTITLLDRGGKVLDANYKKDTDDTIFLHGTLSTGIPLSISLRGGKPFKDLPGLDWRIYGEKGEIHVTAAGPFLQIGYEGMKVEVFDNGKDVVESVDFEGKEGFGELGRAARNVAAVYKLVREEAEEEAVAAIVQFYNKHR